MNEFISAAFPWIVIGISIAVICVNAARKEEQEEKRKWQQRLMSGLAIGLFLGAMMNIWGFWENHAIGLSIGSLFGVMLASLWKENQEEQ